MIDTNKIIAIAERELQDTDMYVVDCKCSPMNEIELFLDSDTRVSVDVCAKLSRAIEAEFDRETEDFQLTVASAGVGSDLKLLRQYKRLEGKSLELLFKDGIKIVAKLLEANEDSILIEYEKRETVEKSSGKKKKEMVRYEQTVMLADLKSAQEYLDFK